MITWNNLDTLASFKELEKVERVNLVEAMTGESGAERVKNYSVPMQKDLLITMLQSRLTIKYWQHLQN